MIIDFNPKIFEATDNNLKKSLAELLLSLSKKNHFIDSKGIKEMFYNNYTFTFPETLFAKEYFSKAHLKDLKKYFDSFIHKSAYITQQHREHLSSITIGINDGEVYPQDAIRIFNERSIVLVENGINDWTFLEGVCKKYTSLRKRKSIYDLIKGAISDDYLEPMHCGGNGEITKISDKLINNRYKDIYKWKMFSVFDSDKPGINMDTPHKFLLKYYKNLGYIADPIASKYYECEESDLMLWHMLHKKKLENYVPVDIIVENTSISQQDAAQLKAFSPETIDYYNYNSHNIGLSKSDIKEIFPKMFNFNFSFKLLEDRCQHHLVEYKFKDGTVERISELEEILLKIAKII